MAFDVEIGPFAEIGVGCKLTGCVIEGKIGDRTVVWRFAHVMHGAKIGSDCMLAQNVFVADAVTIGDRVRIQNNAGIGRLATIGNDVYVGPNVMFANARHPSILGKDGGAMEPIVIDDGVSIGANAVILGGVSIGRGAVIAAGAIVRESVPAGYLVAGVPGRLIRGPKRVTHAALGDLSSTYPTFENDWDGDDG